ncbi:MAG: ImmA/IrrE family metallo-endopeptidase, partial [Ruminococcus flavefaciens]|nr:ImmA/IrrE family metallo-endopeptidase [Ruminococcus flavefaciens]
CVYYTIFCFCCQIGQLYLSGNERGCTFIDYEKRFNIVLKPDDSTQIKRYTIAHELGHIFLDHFVNKTMNSSDMEYQAERFAIDILAPACVLWELNLHTAKDISELCNISMKSAQIRAKRMEILYSRNKFLTSPLERQVCKQFSDFIHQYKSR